MTSVQNLTNSNPWQQTNASDSNGSSVSANAQQQQTGTGQSAQDVTNLLDAAGNGQSWGPAFQQAVQAAGIGNAVANNAGVVTGSNIPQPFAGLSAQDEQAAKDSIWNAIASSPDQQQIWSDLYQANLIPGTGPGDTPIASNQGANGAAGTSGSSTTYGTQGGSAPTSGTNGAGSPTTGTGSVPASGGNGAGSPTTGTGSAPANGGNGTGAGASGPSTATAGVTSVSGNTGSFTPSTLFGYITQSLQQDGVHPNDLSGPGNIGDWDPSTQQGAANLQSYYNGIVGAHNQFYPNVPMDQFARWVVAESAAESTLQPDGGGNGDGVIQANGSVRSDYQQYGVPLVDGSGNTVATPGTKPDSTNPATCVMLWAWRTSSALQHGGNGPAQWSQNVAPTQSANFGNTLSVWLDGPGSPGFYQNGNLDTSGYYQNRVQQFFTKTGGSDAEFQQIAGLPVS